MGVVSINSGPELPVYQCDECLVTGEALGVSMELALTFYVDEQGRPINPNAPDQPFSDN